MASRRLIASARPLGRSTVVPTTVATSMLLGSGSEKLGDRARCERGHTRPRHSGTQLGVRRRCLSTASLYQGSSRLITSMPQGDGGGAQDNRQANEEFWARILGSQGVVDRMLPERQVPDDILSWTLVNYVESGSYIPFPHRDGGIDPRAFRTNPANFKVTLKVKIKDLKLTAREEKRLRCLVGTRFNPGRQEITLITARFMNRGHNQQYLIYLLENLVAEAKKQHTPSTPPSTESSSGDSNSISSAMEARG